MSNTARKDSKNYRKFFIINSMYDDLKIFRSINVCEDLQRFTLPY